MCEEEEEEGNEDDDDDEEGLAGQLISDLIASNKYGTCTLFPGYVFPLCRLQIQCLQRPPFCSVFQMMTIMTMMTKMIPMP